jgi:hypothetical protein
VRPEYGSTTSFGYTLTSFPAFAKSAPEQQETRDGGGTGAGARRPRRLAGQDAASAGRAARARRGGAARPLRAAGGVR